MHPSNAAAIGLRNSLADVGAKGGGLAACRCSRRGMLRATRRDRAIVLVDAAQVLYAAGPAEVDDRAARIVEMSDAPTNNSATGTGSTMVSLFQTDSAAFASNDSLLVSRPTRGRFVGRGRELRGNLTWPTRGSRPA